MSSNAMTNIEIRIRVLILSSLSSTFRLLRIIHRFGALGKGRGKIGERSVRTRVRPDAILRFEARYERSSPVSSMNGTRCLFPVRLALKARLKHIEVLPALRRHFRPVTRTALRLHRKSRIRTTSRVCVPRASTKLDPSAERANLKMRSDLKLVNCLGGSPLMGWLQMLETPLRFCT